MGRILAPGVAQCKVDEHCNVVDAENPDGPATSKRLLKSFPRAHQVVEDRVSYCADFCGDPACILANFAAA
jgi:hypothetical protein